MPFLSQSLHLYPHVFVVKFVYSVCKEKQELYSERLAMVCSRCLDMYLPHPVDGCLWPVKGRSG